MPSLLLCLSIVCISVHACHGGRRLGVTHPNSDKDVAKKMEVDKLAPNKLVKPSAVESGSEHDQSAVGEGKIHERPGGERGKKPKDVETGSRKTKEVHETIISGRKKLVSPSHVDLPVIMTKKLEGTGRMARSVLGTGSQVGQVAVATEERRESGETNAVGDILSMDYEPPHRKPPIHN